MYQVVAPYPRAGTVVKNYHGPCPEPASRCLNGTEVQGKRRDGGNKKVRWIASGKETFLKNTRPACRPRFPSSTIPVPWSPWAVPQAGAFHPAADAEKLGAAVSARPSDLNPCRTPLLIMPGYCTPVSDVIDDRGFSQRRPASEGKEVLLRGVARLPSSAFKSAVSSPAHISAPLSCTWHSTLQPDPSIFSCPHSPGSRASAMDFVNSAEAAGYSWRTKKKTTSASSAYAASKAPFERQVPGYFQVENRSLKRPGSISSR